jgi:PTS system mannose-specific IIA component
MVGLVIATHGRLADELVSTASGIVGPMSAVATSHVAPQASAVEIHDQILQAVKQVDQGDGVLILADLLGGSPCAQSLPLCAQRNIEVVTGVNLPMLLKANSLRLNVQSLPELAIELAQYGQKNITRASALIKDATRGTSAR